MFSNMTEKFSPHGVGEVIPRDKAKELERAFNQAR